MIMQENHEERISLFLIDSPTFPVVLGLPWLASHDPIISWQQRALKGWSHQCSGRCVGVSLGATTVESPNQVSTVHIPPEYAELALAFCKKKATQFPPHRLGDCAIKSSGRCCTSQESRVSSVTGGDGGYGNICYRISGTGKHSAFHFTCLLKFLFDEEDGGLRPCIDYRGLNQITIKYSYPLPLIASMTESLRFFTKLDLRSAYNLVRIKGGDEWKTAFSTTSGHYEYLVMPYRLMNAPSVFQTFVDKFFRDLHGQGVVVYIDDILIYSATRAGHVSLVRRVLG